mmetsp:Transcript_89859/g.254635  ORF Transcript_89859/g.254635 Transcript_89859/m.254635 type:complete len:266 (+) Transcript_89859:735-1532(+)
MPDTSVQMQTSSALSSFPMIVAEKSEPSRPKVVAPPWRAEEAIKPVTIGHFRFFPLPPFFESSSATLPELISQSIITGPALPDMMSSFTKMMSRASTKKNLPSSSPFCFSPAAPSWKFISMESIWALHSSPYPAIRLAMRSSGCRRILTAWRSFWMSPRSAKIRCANGCCSTLPPRQPGRAPPDLSCSKISLPALLTREVTRASSCGVGMSTPAGGFAASPSLGLQASLVDGFAEPPGVASSSCPRNSSCMTRRCFARIISSVSL